VVKNLCPLTISLFAGKFFVRRKSLFADILCPPTNYLFAEKIFLRRHCLFADILCSPTNRLFAHKFFVRRQIIKHQLGVFVCVCVRESARGREERQQKETIFITDTVQNLVCTPTEAASEQGHRERGRARALYRGTSFIRNRRPLGTYSRTMPRALWWS